MTTRNLAPSASVLAVGVAVGLHAAPARAAISAYLAPLSQVRVDVATPPLSGHFYRMCDDLLNTYPIEFELEVRNDGPDPRVVNLSDDLDAGSRGHFQLRCPLTLLPEGVDPADVVCDVAANAWAVNRVTLPPCGRVYLRFRAWLHELDEIAGGIGAVFFEEVVRHLGTAASHAYGGYLAHLTAWAEALKVPYEGVPVGTIKRHASGKGNADKAAMVAAVRARGFSPADDNEADAIALLLWAIETNGGVA